MGFLLFSLLLVPSLPSICLLHQLSWSSWKGHLWFLPQAAGTGLWGTCIQRSSRVSGGISLSLLHLLWATLQQLLMIFYDFGLKEEQQENPGRVNQNYIQKFLAIPGALHDLNVLCIWEARREIVKKKLGFPPPPHKNLLYCMPTSKYTYFLKKTILNATGYFCWEVKALKILAILN